MIENWNGLQECLAHETAMYSEYRFPTKAQYWLSRIKREPSRMILVFLRLSRYADYYELKSQKGSALKFIYAFLCFFFVFRKNRLGERLGLDIGTMNIGKGFMIYHYGNVVNDASVIGDSCYLHGNNCIGNSGQTNECPVLGNNVSLGVGAKIIGNVFIADDIKIGAGSVVIHSCYEKSATLVGIPARVVKRNTET